MTGNAPVKCAFCGKRFKNPGSAILAGGMANGRAWVCDDECRDLWREERDRRKNDGRTPERRAGRDPAAADQEYHGENHGQS